MSSYEELIKRGGSMKRKKKKIWMAVMLAVILLLMIGFLLAARIKEVHIGTIKNVSQQWQSLEKMSKEVMRAIIKRANY